MIVWIIFNVLLGMLNIFTGIVCNNSVTKYNFLAAGLVFGQMSIMLIDVIVGGAR
jgi:hypothetical protein